MTALLVLQTAGLLLLLAASAFFSSAESAYFSLDALRLRELEELHPTRGRRVRAILDDPTRFLSAILVGNTVVNMGVSSVCFALAVHWVPDGYHEQAAFAGAVFLLLVLGEIGPKRVALGHPVAMAAFYAVPLRGCIWAASPVQVALDALTRAFSSSFHPRGRTLNDDELETALDVGEESGVLDAHERLLLRSIASLEEKQASDVMTPRVDIRGIDLNDPPPDLESYVRASRTSHLVLYRDQLDQVDGFLHVRRFLMDPERRLPAATLPPVFVPESSSLERLLGRFLKERIRIAIVVDEYGGTAGLITRGDLAEEIVGEVEDELAPRRPFEELDETRWMVDGQANLEDVNQILGLSLHTESADRVAGWIHERLERLPRPGEVVEDQDCRMTVREMRRQRITLVEVEKRTPPPMDGEDLTP